ncbi:MAG: GTPase Era [Clostridiales bacterium]|nr:GTPase Era [Clostridiales bacterium]
MQSNAKYKSGFVTIIGNPSSGKSTLINALVGEKIAITSIKPQTTRNAIKGIITTKDYQMIFVDTPGVNKSKNKLGQLMNKSINEALKDTDVVIALIDVLRDDDMSMFLGKISKANVPTILLLNKVDKVKDKRQLLEKIEKYKGEYNFDAIIPISARTKDGIEELKETVVKFLPYGPQYYPEDMITDSPERVMVSEIIREKALKFLQDEIPHGIAVDIEKMKKRTGKEITDITATIYCERESHKSIIIGKGGNKLKQIGSEAREDIEKLISMKVYLDIWVKVRNDWRNNEAELRKLNFLQD